MELGIWRLCLVEVRLKIDYIEDMGFFCSERFPCFSPKLLKFNCQRYLELDLEVSDTLVVFMVT